jgi:MFS family permease
MRKGFLLAVTLIAALSGVLAWSVATMGAPHASSGLFRGLGQAGVGLLIAFSVTIASAERGLAEKGRPADHENWLGGVIGVAVCGLFGIGLAFALAEHTAAGHANALDWLGLWWIVSSVSFLGLLVALQPWMGYEWRKLPPRRRWRTERLRSEAPRSRGPAA